MRVRQAKAAPRHKMIGGQPTPKPEAQSHTFPAPIRGWVLNENLAQAQPGGALVLDNFICTTTGIRARGGTDVYATVGASVAVEALFRYASGGAEKFFAATSTSVFDVTTVADPLVIPTAAITGQTSGSYVTEQFGTAGGDYLYAVNGADDAQLFDGTSWTAINGASSPAITGVTTSTLSHVWAFASRLFFVEKDTMNAWYLPVDGIAGEASSFSLAGVFKKGGSLLFGAVWSLDSGDGLDDQCVFVSSEGEVAVYQGTNPGNALEWRLAGVYEITRPLGRKATMQAGGDLLIATESGLVPMSQAVRKDVAAIDLSAVSAPIQPYWQDRAVALTIPWEIEKWASRNIMVVTQPQDAGGEQMALIANLQTGGWSRVVGWDARCLGFFGGFVYFGDNQGRVMKAETGGSDNGLPYTCAFLGQHERLGGGRQVTVHAMRPVWRTGNPIAPKVTAQINFRDDVSSPPNSVADFPGGRWDEALWDDGVWDSGEIATDNAAWVSVGQTGYSIAPEVQLTFGVTPFPRAELVSVDATYSIGAIVA